MKLFPGLIVLAALVGLTASAAEYANRQPGEGAAPSKSISKIYWSDGDSGRLDGKPFRMANVDSPEKGGVGSIGGAKCEDERVLAFEAKAFIVEATRNAEIEIAKSYGADRYGREVVDLRVNGKDLAQLGLKAGHYRPWPHKGQRALSRKPDWCGLKLAAK